MDEYNKELKGNGYRMVIIQREGGWEYTIYNSKGNIICSGDGYESYEQLITENAEMSEALKAIFG